MPTDSQKLLDAMRTAAKQMSPPQAEEPHASPPVSRPAAPSFNTGEVVLGKYRIEEHLGEGGFGNVYRAVELATSETVAIKAPHPDTIATAEGKQRFKQERECLKSIAHDHVVRFIDSSTEGGVPLIVCEFVPGMSLEKWLVGQSLPLDPKLAAAIVLQVARGVAELHRNEKVHCDVKPANLLLDMSRKSNASDFQLGFVVKLVDFGLSHVLESGKTTVVAKTQVQIGTPGYMASEQLDGTNAVDFATDVFALGAILYRMLTGRLPFPKNSHGAAMLSAIRNGAHPPRDLANGIPEPLEILCQRCLEYRASDRLANAQLLVDDLGRYLKGDAILTRRLPRAVRLWRNAQHFAGRASRKWPALIAAAMLFGTLWMWSVWRSEGAASAQRLKLAMEQAAAANSTAEQAAERDRQQKYARAIQSAATALQQGSRRESLKHLNDCRKLVHSPGQLGLEWRLLAALNDDVNREMFGHLGGVLAIGFSPDDRTLYTGGTEGLIASWDTDTWKKRRADVSHGVSVKALAVSDDGTRLAAAGINGRVVVFQAADGKIVFNQQLVSGRVFDVAWLGDSKRLAAGGEDAVLHVVNLATSEQQQIGPLEPTPEGLAHDPNHPNEIVALTHLPDRNLFAVLKAPSEIVFFDAKTLQQEAVWNGDEVTSTGSFCHIPLGPGYLALSQGNHIRVCALPEGKLTFELQSVSAAEQLRFVRPGNLLAASCRDGSVQTWDVAEALADKEPTHRSFPGHKGRARAIGAPSDGRWLVSGGADGKIRVWDNPEFGSSADLPLEWQLRYIQFSPCGRWLGVIEETPDGSSTCHVIEVTTGNQLWNKLVSSLPGSLNNLAFNQQGDEMAIKLSDESLVAVTAKSGDVVNVYAQSAPNCHRFCFTEDGVVANLDGSFTVSFLGSRHMTAEITPPEERLLLGHASTCVGPKWFDTDSHDVIRMTDEPFGAPLRRFDRTSAKATMFAVSPNGRFLAVAGSSQVIHVWNLADDDSAINLVGHEGYIASLQFSPDSQTLLSSAYDGTLRLWHVPTQTPLLTLGSERERMLWMSLHPAGTLLVVGVEREQGHVLRVFRLGPEAESLLANLRLTKN